MILEIGLGDAFGRPFEFNTREFIDANNDPNKGYASREDDKVKNLGIYTDDTQMTIAIGQHMLSDRFYPSSIHYANRFLISYKRDPRGGYSKRLKKALEDSEKPLQFMENILPAGMSSNGSVMRTVPLGLLQDVQQIMAHCIAHTSSTHCTVDAINATIATALTAHYFYHEIGDSYEDYTMWLAGQIGVYQTDNILRAYFETPADGVPCDARITASWCIKACWELDNYKDILKFAVDLGGDVDSVAAVSMGLASLKTFKMKDNISHADLLFAKLENGSYGRDYMIMMDDVLFKRYPKIIKDGTDE